MELSLFDWHCDTAGELLRQKQELTQNTLAVSLENAEKFKHYIQVMAFWTNYRLDDEAGWDHYCKMLNNLHEDPALQNGNAKICNRLSSSSNAKNKLLLAVEDARILANKPKRVDMLYRDGIRIITPLWAGDTCIGGSHNTQNGLTAFGKAALNRASKLGMLLDISHASIQSANDIFEISEQHRRPVIASHSNAYDVCPVSRNLHKDQIEAIVRCRGVIGMNLYQGFLKADGNATAEDLLPHIDYFLEQGAQDVLCLGCDMDGCDLPPDIPDLASLPRLADLMLQHNYPEKLVHAIFFDNAYRFGQKHL